MLKAILRLTDFLPLCACRDSGSLDQVLHACTENSATLAGVVFVRALDKWQHSISDFDIAVSSMNRA